MQKIQRCNTRIGFEVKGFKIHKGTVCEYGGLKRKENTVQTAVKEMSFK